MMYYVWKIFKFCQASFLFFNFANLYVRDSFLRIQKIVPKKIKKERNE